MKHYHYVEEYDSEGGVHHFVVEGNPIKGEALAEYSSADEARHYETLLNKIASTRHEETAPGGPAIRTSENSK